VRRMPRSSAVWSVTPWVTGAMPYTLVLRDP
jgi:hypothetical protein